MILRLLAASLRRRGHQLALIAAAVAVAAASVAALAGFSLRASRSGIEGELAAFGPNLVVRPQVGGPAALAAGELERVAALPGVRSAEGVAAPGGGWVRIEVRAGRERLEEVARAIEARVAGAEARPLLRISAAERDLARRLTLILAAACLVSVLLALVSVAAATTAIVEERRVEVGLMLALGYSGRRIAGFLAAELLAAALVAGVVGEIAGEIAAGRLARGVLDLASPGVDPSWAWAAAPAAALAVVGAAMTFALARIGRVEPARVLRGE